MPLSDHDKRGWLARVPLFQGASAEILDHLLDLTGELTFAAGQPIVLQGQVGNGLYIVVSGQARVVQGTRELDRLGPGDLFGEIAVIDQQPRSASVYAVEPTTCLTIASWDLLALLERDPKLALNLLRELAARVRRADVQLRH
jgi:CRP-like cAMP-binding protein